MSQGIKPTQSEDQPRRRNNGDCCTDYKKAIETGVFRKKFIGRDMEALLKTGLNRCLSTMDLIAYGLAAMLGGSIYVLTGAVMVKRTGPSVFVAYIIAGCVALMNALVYSELACRIPKAGSSYSYAYIILGELPAFLTGWSILLEYILSTSTVARGWSSMLDGLTENRISNWTIQNVGRLSQPGGILAEYLDLVGVLLIFVMAAISCCGVRGSAKVTGFFIGINVFVLLCTSIYMFVYSHTENLYIKPNQSSGITNLDPNSPSSSFLPFGLHGLVGGAAVCFNAFIGFDAISTCAEESKTPNRSLPTANMVSVLIVTLVTMTASLALTLYYPWFDISIDAPFLSALLKNTINGGGYNLRKGMFYFVGCGCLIGLTSSLLSNLVAGPRVSYAMAQDGLLPNICSDVCKPFRTPVIATTFITILTALLDLLFSIESLADFLSLGTLIAYSIASIGLLTLRYRYPPEGQSELDDNKTDKDSLNSVQNLLTADENKIDKPGYLKGSISKMLPKTMVNLLNNGKPGDIVSIILCAYILINSLLILVLNIGTSPSLWPLWRIIFTTIFLVGLLLCILFISLYKQFKAPYPNLFRLPLVPFFPMLTLTVNMFLISQLSWITWARFAIWIVIGLIIYFTFGVCNSYRKAQEEQQTLITNENTEINEKKDFPTFDMNTTQ